MRPFTGEFISPKILEPFLRNPELIFEKRNIEDETKEPMFITVDGVKKPNPRTSYLYEYGVESDYFTIILDGCATVEVGRNEKERMEITAGLFSYYGVDSLLYEHETDPLKSVSKDDDRRPYEPEFSL